MFCQMCDGDVQPVIDIAENGKPIPICGNCQSPLGTIDRPPRPAPPEQVAQQTVTVAAQHQGGDIVGAAKERLKAIDKQLERMAELQRERRKLAAMVAAAEALEDDEHPPALAAAE